MNPITDYVILAILGVLFIRGFRKGFAKIIIGPIAIICALTGAFVYYRQGGSLPICALIAFLGPLIIQIVLTLILRMFTQKSNKEGAPFLTTGKLFGGLVNLVWGGITTALIVLFITILPMNFSWYNRIKEDVLSSRTYGYINRFAQQTDLPISADNYEKALNVFKDPAKTDQLRESPAFQKIAENKTMKTILEDEDIQFLLKEKEFTKLLLHPKMQTIFQDKELIEDIMKLNKEILKQSEE